MLQKIRTPRRHSKTNNTTATSLTQFAVMKQTPSDQKVHSKYKNYFYHLILLSLPIHSIFLTVDYLLYGNQMFEFLTIEHQITTLQNEFDV